MTRRLITRAVGHRSAPPAGADNVSNFTTHATENTSLTEPLTLHRRQDLPQEQRDIIILVNHHNKLLMPGPIIQTTTRHFDQHSGTAVKHALSIINYQQGGPHTSSQLTRQRLRPVTGAPGISLQQRLHQTSPINQAHITWRTYIRNFIHTQAWLNTPTGRRPLAHRRSHAPNRRPQKRLTLTSIKLL